MKSLRQASSAARSTAAPRGVRAPKNSISLPPSACRAAPPPALGHRAHRRRAGAGADHQQVRLADGSASGRCAPNGPIDLHRVAALRGRTGSSSDAAHRLAVVVLGDALHRQRDVVVAAAARRRAGSRPSTGARRAAGRARRRRAARCRSTGLRAPGTASRRNRARCGACRCRRPPSVSGSCRRPSPWRASRCVYRLMYGCAADHGGIVAPRRAVGRRLRDRGELAAMRRRGGRSRAPAALRLRLLGCRRQHVPRQLLVDRDTACAAARCASCRSRRSGTARCTRCSCCNRRRRRRSCARRA